MAISIPPLNLNQNALSSAGGSDGLTTGAFFAQEIPGPQNLLDGPVKVGGLGLVVVSGAVLLLALMMRKK